RPPTPPPNGTSQDSTNNAPISIEISIERETPERTSSTDSASSSSSRKNSMSRKPSIPEPTNTLIITPLPLPFFEPKILDALKSHFASFSTTFLHRRSPYSPVSVPGPGASIKGEPSMDREDGSPKDEEMMDAEDELPEGDLYSFVPLKSFRRAIVVYYSAEDAERARIASDRLYIPETPKCPAITLRAFRAPETVLVEEGWFSGGTRKTHPAISDDAEEGAWYFGGFPVFSSNFDEGEIKESPFHLRPPVPERNFLISPPGSPPVGWVAVREDPPNESPLAEDLVQALERLKAQSLARRTRKRKRGTGAFRASSRSRSRSHERGSQSSGASL
ncbi:11295_t:CDS:2, partial [Acaulospora colombiana]